MRRLDNIDLRLLRVFVTLAEAGGFADALLALNMSQPTLSGHLAALERRLGGALCERGRRGFRLTPFGEATFRAAQQLFADIERFHQQVGSRTGELVGRLRLGIVDGVASSDALGLQGPLGRFCARAPSVFVDLELGTPIELERAVADGGRDVVIGPFSQRAPGVAYLPVYREPHALYCGRSHPLFAVEDARLTHAAIEQAGFSIRGYRQMEDLYRADHPRASAMVVHMEAQVMLILSGHFIGFLPNHIAAPWMQQGAMRALRPAVYGFESTHFAAYRRRDEANPLVRSFLEAIRENLAAVAAAREVSRAKASTRRRRAAPAR